MDFCKKEGIRHFICDSEELKIEGFAQNPKNRCYLCKHELFEEIKKIAEEIKKNNDKYLETIIMSQTPAIIEKDICVHE